MLLGVDVGGTFTDAVAVTPAGEVYTAKTPTTPADQSEGVLRAIAAVLERAGAQPHDVTRLAHGMTVATNALLEGNAARTALIASEGMGDIVELGRQARAHLYRLCERGPRPLAVHDMRFEALERMGPSGAVLARARCRRGGAARGAGGAERAAGGGRRAAAQLRRCGARAVCWERCCTSGCRTYTCRCPASWWARSASTSVLQPRSSMRRCRRCCASTWSA